jgi:amphi-Trp domain-containing protein
MSDHEAPEKAGVTTEETETEAESERTLIRQGRDFEQEYRLSAEETGEFLVALGKQLQSGDELTLRTDEWELPFAFGETVSLEIDFEGVGEPELEIELEIPGKTDEEAPEVS